jgi:RNA polymerase sigma factor (sigma-70 family)
MALAQLRPIVRLLHHLGGAQHADDADDATLLGRFTARREEAAFAALMRRHAAVVWDVCRSILHADADAEDAFQATFLVLAHKAASLRNPGSVAGWLHSVAYRVAVRARAASARRRFHERQAAAMAEVNSPDEATGRDLRSILHEELQCLPERFRAALVLCYLEGKTYEEAAGQLGCPVGTVSSRLARGRDLLRARLTRRGLACSAGLLAAALEPAAFAAVPVALPDVTLRAALLFAGGTGATAGILSARIVILAQGTLKALAAAAWRRATATVLALSLAGTLSGLGVCWALAGAPPGSPKVDLPAAPGPAGPQEAVVKPRASLEGHGDIVNAVVFAPNGKSLVTVSGPPKKPGEVIVWDAVTGEKKARVEEAEGIRALAFALDGKVLATADYAGAAVRLRDPAGGGVRAVLRQHGAKVDTIVNTVAFTPDGRTLAAGFLDGTVELWDVKEGKVRTTFSTPGEGVYSVAASPDGRVLATVGQGATVKLWEVATGKPLGTLTGHGREVEHVAFSPDGRTLASASWDGTVKLWEVATFQERLTLRGPRSAVLGVAFSPDGRRLAAAVGVWAEYGHADRVGPRVGEVRLWDLASAKEVACLAGHTDRVWGVAFSPDGRTLASACWDRKVRLWDVAPPRAAAAPIPDEKELEKHWQDLASTGHRAYQAVRALSAAADHAVPFLAAHLRRPGGPARSLERLINALDDDSFVTREKATAELERLGPAAWLALRKALAGTPSAEARRRIEALLSKEAGPTTDPETVRAIRAVEVLENSATPAALKALTTLAEGAADARLTLEAKAALGRLTRRSAAP